MIYFPHTQTLLLDSKCINKVEGCGKFISRFRFSEPLCVIKKIYILKYIDHFSWYGILFNMFLHILHIILHILMFS